MKRLLVTDGYYIETKPTTLVPLHKDKIDHILSANSTTDLVALTGGQFRIQVPLRSSYFAAKGESYDLQGASLVVDQKGMG